MGEHGLTDPNGIAVTGDLLADLGAVLNAHGIDTACEAADYVLAAFLVQTLAAFRVATSSQARTRNSFGPPAPPSLRIGPRRLVDRYTPPDNRP